MATNPTHQKWADRQIAALLDLGIDLADAQASVQWVLDHLPEGSKVVLDATDTAYIDYDVLESIRDFLRVNAPARNIQFTLRGFKDKYKYWVADFVHVESASANRAKTVKQDLQLSEPSTLN